MNKTRNYKNEELNRQELIEDLTGLLGMVLGITAFTLLVLVFN